MKYIIIETENITQDILNDINGNMKVVPSLIYIEPPELGVENSGIRSQYSTIELYDDFPKGLAGYKKFTKSEYDAAVELIKMRQPIENKIKTRVESVNEPFASKTVSGSKKLFKRVHGVEATLSSSPYEIDFVIPYNTCKITGVEILNGALGDKVDLLVYDTPTGAISGFPNVQLNQFGFGVFIDQGFHREVSNYDADLIKDMKIRIRFYSSSLKTVYVNLILHEVK